MYYIILYIYIYIYIYKIPTQPVPLKCGQA